MADLAQFNGAIAHLSTVVDALIRSSSATVDQKSVDDAAAAIRALADQVDAATPKAK